ncbi:HORMA domain-containing protein 1-like [Dendronephthya gigantea]|uniref:HORMA domain-containing protein 1-like n=1 Tax=Dendronephthya gigantea TaxID=151771 RepID=UPI00106CE282|nr:HORMA domain-containing protein 1-like [Dendronephthya gigantea]
MPMATSQLKKPEVKTGSWSSIFNSSEQLNETQSALFVKKLLAVAISSVTYLRAVFPERCFGDRCLEDLNLKILRDEDAFPGSSQVIQWVKGCFNAIDKKYLRKIILGVSATNLCSI